MNSNNKVTFGKMKFKNFLQMKNLADQLKELEKLKKSSVNYGKLILMMILFLMAHQQKTVRVMVLDRGGMFRIE